MEGDIPMAPFAIREAIVLEVSESREMADIGLRLAQVDLTLTRRR